MTTASNPLARLIDETKEANQWSDMRIVDQARGAGHQMSKSTISEIRTTGVSTIVPRRIEALASGLQLPVREVLRAALESAGLPGGESPLSVEQAIQRDVGLAVETKRALMAMLRDARRHQRNSAAHVQDAPIRVGESGGGPGAFADIPAVTRRGEDGGPVILPLDDEGSWAAVGWRADPAEFAASVIDRTARHLDDNRGVATGASVEEVATALVEPLRRTNDRRVLEDSNDILDHGRRVANAVANEMVRARDAAARHQRSGEPVASGARSRDDPSIVRRVEDGHEVWDEYDDTRSKEHKGE